MTYYGCGEWGLSGPLTITCIAHFSTIRDKGQFRKDFFGIFETLKQPFFSEYFCNVSVVRPVDCIRLTLLKGNSTTYVFPTIFPNFSAQYFKTPSCKSTITEFSRVLGFRLYSCLILKSDCTRDNFLKLFKVKLTPPKSLRWIGILLVTCNIYKNRLAHRRCPSDYCEKYHAQST